MRRLVALAALAALVLGVLPGTVAAQELPPYPERAEWYAYNDEGHFTDGTRVRIDESCVDVPAEEQVACSLEAFRAKPFTVIAFVDSGINPYHQDFRAPEFVHHPSTFVEGYPAEATSVDLSFDVADTEGYAAARDADEDALFDIEGNRLYWIPGTRIIGGLSTRAGGAGAFPERKIIDENGHGTGVASVAAGQFYGSNPNALIVAVEGLGDASLEWATAQPWIDIVSNSWGNIGNVPLGSADDTREATRRGQTVAFAGGNGTSNQNSHQVFAPTGPVPVDDPCECKFPDSNPTFTSPYGGASWVLTVGAASPINGQAHWWHSVPVDVSSFGSKWRAAHAFGVTREENRDFGGTSCATPVTAGVLSTIIERARFELGDTTQGQRPDQAVAVAAPGVPTPAEGPIADGVLTRLEAEALVQKTAFPVPFDPEKASWDYAIRPTTDLYYAYQGYGVVNRDSRDLAHEVLLGNEPMPDRAAVDSFIAHADTLRNAFWGNP
jgi:hypothetical protein